MKNVSHQNIWRHIIIKLLLIVLGIISLLFQTAHFVFGTLNRRYNENESSNYIFSDVVPHLFTLIICIWFVGYQLRTITENTKKGAA